MRSMGRKGGLVSLLVLCGCGGELSDDGSTGTAVAELTVVPGGVQCVRVTIRGAALSFNVSPGASSTTLDLGVQAGGSVQVSAQAYDVACGSVTTATAATWVSDAVSVSIASGFSTSIPLTLRPATRASASVDFVVPAVAIAAGSNSMFAVMQDGTVRAWGRNFYGQLGDGTTTDRSTPVAVVGLAAGARQVAAGEAHACALTGSGVYCWGGNGAGQLGDGTTTDHRTPTAIDAGAIAAPITSVTAGWYHTCGASSSNGRVYCWGRNNASQLGDGTTADRSRPVAVGGGFLYAPVAQDDGTCAFSRSGQLGCWGFNGSSRFGGGPAEEVYSATTFFTPRVWGNVAFSYDHACMFEPNGTLYCAGNNAYGQLGDGSTAARSAPVQVPGLTDVTAVATGFSHSCALRQDRTVWCWGEGFYGALGGGTSDLSTSPTQVLGLRDAVAIAAGNSFSCALLADGSVRCWGYNNEGQLGDGTLRNQSLPVRVRL